MEHVTEVRVKFSKEEMEAIKTIAEIECGGTVVGKLCIIRVDTRTISNIDVR